MESVGIGVVAMKYTFFYNSVYGYIEAFCYGDTDVIRILPDGNEFSAKIVVDETDAMFNDLPSLSDEFAKFDYIKRWYKVINGQLVKQTTEVIKRRIVLNAGPSANVNSTVTVGVSVYGADGDTLSVSADHGILSALTVTIYNGEGSFTITCNETVVTTIRVWHPQNKYKSGEIKIQFRPV